MCNLRFSLFHKVLIYDLDILFVIVMENPVFNFKRFCSEMGHSNKKIVIFLILART